MNRRIEDTFNARRSHSCRDCALSSSGATRIFDPDRNNFAPRVGIAYSPNPPSRDRLTVVRAGYGLFYDQILGAVVSQSRNVFPSFLTVNFGGLNASFDEFPLTFFNPARTVVVTGQGLVPLVAPGTVNRMNPAFPLSQLLQIVNSSFPSALGITLPTRRLETPMAHHYNVTLEQQLSRNMTFSLAYVGTSGRHLLRFTTPNLGPASTLVPTSFGVFPEQFNIPDVLGRVRSPPRPVSGVGAINRFEATASSRYDSLQLQFRGRTRSRAVTSWRIHSRGRLMTCRTYSTLPARSCYPRTA